MQVAGLDFVMAARNARFVGSNENLSALKNLKPGITEIIIHLGHDGIPSYRQSPSVIPIMVQPAGSGTMIS